MRAGTPGVVQFSQAEPQWAEEEEAEPSSPMVFGIKTANRQILNTFNF